MEFFEIFKVVPSIASLLEGIKKDFSDYAEENLWEIAKNLPA
jgi:hypothetical protein